jgi:hypothetical protein
LRQLRKLEKLELL